MSLNSLYKGFTFILLLSLQNLQAQWKTAAAEKLNIDVIINYDVIYEKELSQKQKASSSYIKEIVVAFNKNVLKETRFGNSFTTQRFTILDYNEEIFYSCTSTGSSKIAVSNKFKNPFKEAELQVGKSKIILGLPCEEYIAIVKGVPEKIYSTKKVGLRFVKHLNIPGFLMQYSAYDKYLGKYQVVAKKINYSKLPASYYSLNGYQQITEKEYLESRKPSSEKYKPLYDKMIGSTAPKYRFRTLSGEKITSKSTLGKIVVLNFWFTTCPPCRSEIPHLNTIKEEFKDDPNVVFIGVALDDKSRLNSFLKKTKFDYGIVSDGRFEAKLFDVPAYPTNIIIDQAGKIQFYKTGGLTGSSVKSLSYKIDDLLELN
ncbi:TlpA family protein disulfide reductase [Flavicella sediminum]|uniref:TlpA family protein disulfide reductase n=1 Tax=Flavicella sediminum TaxID=2585141 RepID=UPI001121A112|nr:TlpA disulfide reductase family protein [Flavicella sediminum]